MSDMDEAIRAINMSYTQGGLDVFETIRDVIRARNCGTFYRTDLMEMLTKLELGFLTTDKGGKAL